MGKNYGRKIKTSQKRGWKCGVEDVGYRDEECGRNESRQGRIERNLELR